MQGWRASSFRSEKLVIDRVAQAVQYEQMHFLDARRGLMRHADVHVFGAEPGGHLAAAVAGARSISNRLTSSAAKCCASAAEPPLPHANTLPPPLSESASILAALAIGSPSTSAACCFSLALSANCAAIRPRSAASALDMRGDSTPALFAERVADPLHVARRPVDEEYIEAASRLGSAREVKARRGNDARALRRRHALGGATEAAGRAHADLGEDERRALLGDQVDLTQPAAPVALHQLEARRAHEIRAEVLGSRAFPVHGTLNG